MILEFSRITAPPVRDEWDKAVDSISSSGVVGVIQSEGYLLKLIF
jgi:hypothetical protein